ncbi:MAG: hypothetical protein ACLPJJ_08425, partial [Acidocella sp.]
SGPIQPYNPTEPVMSNVRTLLASALMLSTIASGSAFAAPPVLEPTTQHFIDSLSGAKPIYAYTPAQARALLDQLQSGPVAKPDGQY